MIFSVSLVASILLTASSIFAAPSPSTKLHPKRQWLDKRAGYWDFFPVIAQNATYDFIVVGGGSAGLATASRLAESNYTVAIVEAGGFYEIENGNTSVVPAYSTPYDAIT